MYTDILIPTDGRAGMERVSAHALTLAELCEARIHVVNVVDETTYMTLPDDVRDQLQQTFEEDGHSATKIIAERAIDRGLDVRREIRWGDPAVAIIAYAIENEIDIIVMGTRGKTGFERYLLGSVAEKVVRVSPVPVMTVHTGDREELLSTLDELVGV
ncbi:universal stress protein [Haladaptatus sp. GCM10025707]|uniref:universal stress protein n=1 Tax=unclassified Haladaptatus TaxID=2622732 RepID=UPI0023E8FB02|nr:MULTISPECIES: universal stress protein [unclassified Haladaptatus]